MPSLEGDRCPTMGVAKADSIQGSWPSRHGTLTEAGRKFGWGFTGAYCGGKAEAMEQAPGLLSQGAAGPVWGEPGGSLGGRLPLGDSHCTCLLLTPCFDLSSPECQGLGVFFGIFLSRICPLPPAQLFLAPYGFLVFRSSRRPLSGCQPVSLLLPPRTDLGVAAVVI